MRSINEDKFYVLVFKYFPERTDFSFKSIRVLPVAVDTQNLQRQKYIITIYIFNLSCTHFYNIYA